MTEYYTRALVLDNLQLNEIDREVVLFTYDFGKLKAKVKSGSKINSKLNPHLQAGSIINARLLAMGEESSRYQIVDALQTDNLFVMTNNSKSAGDQILYMLTALKALLPAELPEPDIWQTITNKQKMDSPRQLLSSLLGLDIEESRCHHCAHETVSFIDLSEAGVVCQNCYGRLMTSGNFLDNFQNQRFLKILKTS